MFVKTEVKVFDFVARDKLGISISRSRRDNIVWLSTHDLMDSQVLALSHIHGGCFRVEKTPVTFSDTENMVEIIKYFSEDGSFVYVVPPSWGLISLMRNPLILKNASFRRFKGLIVSEDSPFSIVENKNKKNKEGKTIFTEELILAMSKISKMRERSRRVS